MTRAAPKIPLGVLVASAVVLAVGAVELASHQEQAREVLNDLAAIPLFALAVAFCLVLCQWGCQALRLWALVPRSVPLTLGRTVYAFGVGEWVNLVTPARAGDAFKVVLLRRAGDARPVSVPRATGVMLADKILDVGAMVFLCGVTGLLGLVGAGASARLPTLRLVLASAVLLVLVLWGIRWVRPEWFARLTHLRHELGRGLSALTDPIQIVGGSALSLGAWIAELLAIRTLVSGLGFSVSPSQIVFALAALNVGISMPVSMANVGVYEAALAFGLHRAGLPLPSAVAIATLHHALELVGITVGAAGAQLALWTRRVAGAGGRVDG